MFSPDLLIISTSVEIFGNSSGNGDSGMGGRVSSSEFSIFSLERREFLAWKRPEIRK